MTMKGQGEGGEPPVGPPTGLTNKQPQKPRKGHRELMLQHFVDFFLVAVIAIGIHGLAALVGWLWPGSLLFYIFVAAAYLVTVGDVLLLAIAVIVSVAPGFYRRYLQKWFED